MHSHTGVWTPGKHRERFYVCACVPCVSFIIQARSSHVNPFETVILPWLVHVGDSLLPRQINLLYQI